VLNQYLRIVEDPQGDSPIPPLGWDALWIFIMQLIRMPLDEKG